jgi:hypothetical protein
MSDKLVHSLASPIDSTNKDGDLHIDESEGGQLYAGRQVLVRNECGHPVLHIKYPDSGHWKRLITGIGSGSERGNASSGASEYANAFGIQYHFQLLDSNEEAAVNAPEWCGFIRIYAIYCSAYDNDGDVVPCMFRLVPLGEPLEYLLQKHSLQLVYSQNFHEYMKSQSKLPTFEYVHWKYFVIVTVIGCDAVAGCVRLSERVHLITKERLPNRTGK